MPRINYVIYKLTFPNRKIYIGKDVGGNGHSLRYFGSWDNEMVMRDFSDDELRDFTVRKQILFESTDKNEANKKEFELIREYNSNDYNIGYNRN